ncbi:hypothetical protein PWT90_06431 [Aphanocladium album]|nr:hypothetical protein PWT90_06431 [Aphanocladium album]
MRALTKAAALLLAVSVVAESMPGPVRRVSATETIPTAYITLNVPVDGAETQVVPLRLDLVEADEACSPAKLSVDGRRLAQDADGFGQGALTLDNGIAITSNWTFACHSLKQALTINIHSVNGNPAVDTSFTTSFYQTTPVQIASVENVADVRYLHLRTTVTESLADSGDEHVDIEGSYYEGSEQKSLALSGNGGSSVEDEVSRLKDLRAQARELAALIRDQETALLDKLEHNLRAKLASEPAPTPLEECRDVRCAFKALVHKFRHGHEEVCESSSGWRTFFGCAPRDDEDDFATYYDEDYEYEMEMEDMDWEQEEEFYLNYEEEMAAAYYEATRARMLMIVAETAFIFGIAVFGITAFIRRLISGRRHRPRTSNELPLYQAAGHYFDEPKTLISFHAADEDKSRRREAAAGSYPDEKAILRAADEAAAASQKKNCTTVADEISELREAASVVSDLVAVEAAERRSSVDYDDEAPPAYERVDEREHSL